MKKVKVRDIAFGRSGDKGDISNVLIIPSDEKNYDLLLRELTVERVKEAYKGMVKGEIKRYEVPGVKAINFVMYKALDGGVSKSLCIDVHGKSRCAILQDMDIEVPE